ncbi:MAG: ATP-dependent DNA ligase, partial [Solirubrobacteraceae bacterium]
GTVPDHLAEGNPWADMEAVSFALEPLLDLWESLPGGELSFPPDYPKMPGEPPRVQPSRKVAENWQ